MVADVPQRTTRQMPNDQSGNRVRPGTATARLSAYLPGGNTTIALHLLLCSIQVALNDSRHINS